MLKVTFVYKWDKTLRKTVTAENVTEAWRKIGFDMAHWLAWEFEEE